MLLLQSWHCHDRFYPWSLIYDYNSYPVAIRLSSILLDMICQVFLPDCHPCNLLTAISLPAVLDLDSNLSVPNICTTGLLFNPFSELSDVMELPIALSCDHGNSITICSMSHLHKFAQPHPEQPTHLAPCQLTLSRHELNGPAWMQSSH